MDPLAIIAARQQYERLAEVSRTHHRFGSAYRSDRSIRRSVAVGMVTRLRDAVSTWWSRMRVGRVVAASQRSAPVGVSPAGDSPVITVSAEINRPAVGN
jgi:hypothetical protein